MGKTNKNKYIFAIILSVFTALSVLGGTSYALLRGTATASKEQIIKAGSVKLSLTESFDDIDASVTAMSDALGISQDTIYEFSITNIGDAAAMYDLKLINEAPDGYTGTVIPDNYIKVGLQVNGIECGPMNLSDVNNIIDSSDIYQDEVIHYKLRIWFDQSNESALAALTDAKMFLKLKLEATQRALDTEPATTVLYSDGTLIINEPESKRDSNIAKHGTVSSEYDAFNPNGTTDVEKYVFTDADSRPWNSERASITSVELGQRISPTSTAFWFYGLSNLASANLTNLDMSLNTSMRSMFNRAGNDASVTSFSLVGLSKWDTSKVANMSYVFYEAGKNATTWNIGDISNWNTSSVTTFQSLFYYAANSADVVNLNLSKWNTENTTIMSSMFNHFGSNATVWSVGNLSGWDTSSVQKMVSMFNGAATNASVFELGNIGAWDVSTVDNMSGMFESAGQNATTWNIGNLSKWNTSSVTDMSYLFNRTGMNNNSNIGSLNIYANNIDYILQGCKFASIVLNIYSNPTSYTNIGAEEAATGSNAIVVINYSTTTTNIDEIVYQQYTVGNVIKGAKLD